MSEPYLEVLFVIVEGTDIREIPAALYRAEGRMPENQGVEDNVKEIAAEGVLREYEGGKWKAKPCRCATVVVPRDLFDAAIAEALKRNDHVAVACRDWRDGEESVDAILAVIGPSTELGPKSCAPWITPDETGAPV